MGYASPKTKVFRGLNTVSDPLRLGLAWQRTADNVNITNRNAIERCEGFTERVEATSLTGAYATKDLQRLYVVDNGTLLQITPAGSVTLTSGLASATARFEEVNGVVYFTNGTDYGVIRDGQYAPWGVSPPAAPTLSAGTGVLKAGVYSAVCTLTDQHGAESGSGDVATIAVTSGSSIAITNIQQVAGYTTNVHVTAFNAPVYYLLKAGAGTSFSYNCLPDALGDELPFWNMDMPRGFIPRFWGGQMWLAEYFPAADMSVVWGSYPMHFHLYDLGEDAIAVPGEVRMLAAVDEALLIGTDRRISAYTGEALSTLAEYGVVPGIHDTIFAKQCFFWSLRGACKAMPFENITASTLSVAPGLSAGGAVIERDGMRRYVVALKKGGLPAYNTRN